MKQHFLSKKKGERQHHRKEAEEGSITQKEKEKVLFQMISIFVFMIMCVRECVECVGCVGVCAGVCGCVCRCVCRCVCAGMGAGIVITIIVKFIIIFWFMIRFFSFLSFKLFSGPVKS